MGCVGVCARAETHEGQAVQHRQALAAVHEQPACVRVVGVTLCVTLLVCELWQVFIDCALCA